MKKRICSVFFIGMLLLCPLAFVACDDGDDCGTILTCGDDNGCCPPETPWTDRHGSCYSTLSYCRESGWACVGCY
jgi:hypothetical protein